MKDYVPTEWVGGPDGKIFGPRSWRTDPVQRGPCAMTECQIFSRPTRPNSINKYFIIWPPRFSFFFSLFFFSSNKIRYRNVHLVARFDRKGRIYYGNKVVSVRVSQRAVRDPSRAWRLFLALLAPYRVWPSYGLFLNSFAMKAGAGPYRSYDN